MDNTQLLNELYEKIMANRRSDMSDDVFIGLLDDLHLAGFNEALAMSDDIAFEMDLAN